MGLLSIKKKNKGNTYFTQDPNMMNNQYYEDPGMYNQGMPDPNMMNNGMAPNMIYNNPNPNMMPPQQQGGMMPPNPNMMPPQQQGGMMPPNPNMMPPQQQGGMMPPPNQNRGPAVMGPSGNRGGMVELPKTEPPAPEELESLEEEPALPREVESLDGPAPKEDNLNPLDNDKNPVPVNPIVAELESHQNVEDIGEQRDVKANLFAALGIIFGMVVHPGTTMLNNAKKFKKMDKAMSILMWLAFIFLILCLVIRVLVGSFDRTYSSLTDSYKLVFNPARIMQMSNYLEYIIIAAALSIGGVLLVALIYYASSFLNSKGVHFSTYLIVSNLGMIPLISGVIILYPIGKIFNIYLGLGVLIFSFLATIITLLIGMNEVLRFKDVNNQIFYHVINLSIITLIAIVVFVFMLQHAWISIPQLGF